MARTAVIAGTATAVSGSIRDRQIASAQQQQLAAQQAAAPQAPPPPAPPAAADDPTLAQLTQLGQLKSQGVLTDAEFTAAKAKLLGL
jgi:hypothetical protein